MAELNDGCFCMLVGTHTVRNLGQDGTCVRNTVKMPANSCRAMYEERKYFANVAVMSSWS